MGRIGSTAILTGEQQRSRFMRAETFRPPCFGRLHGTSVSLSKNFFSAVDGRPNPTLQTDERRVWVRHRLHVGSRVARD